MRREKTSESELELGWIDTSTVASQSLFNQVLLTQHTFNLLYHHQTRTRTIAARVSMLSAISNEPATFSILRLDRRTRPYWTAE